MAFSAPPLHLGIAAAVHRAPFKWNEASGGGLRVGRLRAKPEGAPWGCVQNGAWLLEPLPVLGTPMLSVWKLRGSLLRERRSPQRWGRGVPVCGLLALPCGTAPEEVLGRDFFPFLWLSATQAPPPRTICPTAPPAVITVTRPSLYHLLPAPECSAGGGGGARKLVPEELAPCAHLGSGGAAKLAPGHTPTEDHA